MENPIYMDDFGGTIIFGKNQVVSKDREYFHPPKSGKLRNFWIHLPSMCFSRSLGGGGVVIPLVFPKVPQSSLMESLRVPQSPPFLEHPPPLKNPTTFCLQQGDFTKTFQRVSL